MTWRAHALVLSILLMVASASAADLPGCDFDGSFSHDIAIGVPGEKLVASGEGAVSVIYDDQSADDELLHQGLDGTTVAKLGDGFGEALACGDFNQDQFDDLAVGVPGRDVNGYQDNGTVWVFFGGKRGFETKDGVLAEQVQIWDEVQIVGTSGDRHGFGQTLEAGDFDNDGCDDLAIAAPGADFEGEDAAGAVYVLYSDCELGLRVEEDKGFYLNQNMDGLWDQPEAGDGFGSALQSGDFNGDQFDDLAVGVPGEDEFTVSLLENVGSVNVFYGGSDGLYVGNVPLTETIFQNTMKDGLQEGDQFGFSLASTDFDADGFDDLAVGVPFEDLELVVSSVIDAGAVNVLYGTSCGLLCQQSRFDFWHQDVEIDGQEIDEVAEAGDQFGYALSVGDLCQFSTFGSWYLEDGTFHDSHTWSQENKDINDDAEVDDRFGEAIG